MMPSRRFDAVVVGAGPAGSTTAALLAEVGLRVAVFDRATFPRPKACAEYLSPEAGRVLDRLGVLNAVRGAGAATLAGMRVVSVDGSVFTGWFRGAEPFRGYRDHGFGLPRGTLDQLLVQAATARGAQLHERTVVLGVGAPTGAERTLTVRSGGKNSTVRARVVIGADGLHSRIARAMGVVRRGRLKRVALVTHARDVGGMSEVGEMHVSRDGYVGLAAVGGGITNVALVVDRRRVRPTGTSLSQFQALLSRFPAVQERMRDATFTDSVLAAGPFARYTVRATGDRMALVGDAADFYDPFTGEGIYAALRGGELLADVLVAALERDTLRAADLARYDRMRRDAFGRKWILERIIAFAVGRPALLNYVSRRLAVRQRLADLLVGVTGDFVPAAEVLRPSFVWQLVR